MEELAPEIEEKVVSPGSIFSQEIASKFKAVIEKFAVFPLHLLKLTGWVEIVGPGVVVIIIEESPIQPSESLICIECEPALRYLKIPDEFVIVLSIV